MPKVSLVEYKLRILIVMSLLSLLSCQRNPLSDTGYSTTDLNHVEFNYSGVNGSGSVRVPMRVAPSSFNNNGFIPVCTVSPNLPSGLSIEPSTCVISGIPLVVQSQTNYIVTAVNAAGLTRSNVMIRVNPSKPFLNFNFFAGEINKPLTITPVLYDNGSTITGCSVSPDLPVGFSINNLTCVITGQSSEYINLQTYSVSVTNVVGTTSASMSFLVASHPVISYEGVLSSGNVANFMTISPSELLNQGADITGCSVLPTLPDGLTIDSSSCTISGTPTVTDFRSYVVTATNAVGSSSANLSLSISPSPPNISYAGVSGMGFVALPFLASPSTLNDNRSAITDCRSQQILPVGLAVDPITCVVSGIPTVTSSITNYTITAQNSIGSGIANFSMTILPSAPTISYSGVSGAGSYNQSFSMVPSILNTNGSSILNCTVVPNLPAGLSIHASTCIISGVPSQLSPETNYTVTITNSAGSTNASLSLSVGGNLAFTEDGNSQSVSLHLPSGTLGSSCSALSFTSSMMVDTSISGIHPNCSATITPILNKNGSDTIQLRLNNNPSSSSNLSLSISQINDAPVISSMSNNSTNEDTAKSVSFSFSDIDSSPNCTSSISVTSTNTTLLPVSNITKSGTGTNCSLLLSPALNQSGSTNITVTVSDGSLSHSTIFNLTVSPVDDAPVASNISVSINEDVTTLVTLSYSDVENDPATSCEISPLTNLSGTCSCLNGVCKASVTGSSNYNGISGFAYTVTANSQVSNSATASVTVVGVNDAPVIGANQSFSTRDNFGFNFTLNNGSDIDSSNLSYKILSSPAIGTISNCINTSSYSSDLTCTYTAPVNYHGMISFTYEVYDGSLKSLNFAIVTIDVQDQTSTVPNLSPYNFSPTVVTTHSLLTLTPANCNDISQILISESVTPPTVSSSGWQNCSTSNGSITFNPTITNQQGFRTMRAYGRDPQNNISTYQIINFIYDSLAPQIMIENIPTLPNGISYSIKWRLTEASISASAQFTLESSLNNGSSWSNVAQVSVGQNGPLSSTLYVYNWPVPSGIYVSALFRIKLTDNTGLTGMSTSNTFRILEDLVSPNLISGEMKINNSTSPNPTPKKYVNVSFRGVDGDTNITHFCLKTLFSPPSSSDQCWRAVDAPQPGLSPSENLQLTNFPFLLGFTPGSYRVYAWTKDLKGNISTNTQTVGRDLVNIQHYLDAPPVISNFFVSNTFTPSNPIASDEMVFDSGDMILIKWRAIDDYGINPTIKLQYTTNDTTYTQIAVNLSNGVNNCPGLNESGTSLDDGSTGCYKWVSPVTDTQYFKIRLIVEDSGEQATSVSSQPLNSPNFKILAGNMEPGVGSSAKSAIITPTQLYSLAVTSDGKVFIRDGSFGLMYVDPISGVYERLVPTTGSSTGDNGPVGSASFRSLDKIALDYQDRLLVWDYDRIRRINTKTNPMTIETIIGARNNGAVGTQTTDIVTDPADLKVFPGPPAYSLLQALPNGDIYFQSGPYGTVNGGNLLRIYRGSLPNPDIITIRVSGQGAFADFNGPLSMTEDTMMGYYIAFDPNTSLLKKMMVKVQRYPIGCSFFTHANIDLISYSSTAPHPPTHASTCGDSKTRVGNDGNIYHEGQFPWEVRVSKYDIDTNSNVRILGSGQGFCPDGTSAQSCKSRVTDMFINPSGMAFFIDNGLVRVIDGNGNVQTLYGQRKSYGDGGLGADARFNSVWHLSHGVGDDVIVYDGAEILIKEIRPNNINNQVVKIAGNGESAGIDWASPAVNQTVNGSSWDQPGTLVSNPNNGDIFFPCSWGLVCKLPRSTGIWEVFSGQGSTHWTTTGSVHRTSIRLGGYVPTIFAYHEGKMITGSYEWSGSTSMNSALRQLSEVDDTSRFVAGKVELDGASSCPDGAGNQCNLAVAKSQGLAFTYDTANNSWLYEHQGWIKSIRADDPNGYISRFVQMPEGIRAMVYNNNFIYYCSDSGAVKKWNLSSGVITSLTYPTSTIACHGFNILYKPGSAYKPNRLIFPFSQNGLQGVAEYYLD